MPGMLALIVDETDHVARRLDTSLGEEGYAVATAASRGEALWLAGSGEADVVIVCAARAGLHDVPTIEALRRDGEQAPILVLARAADSDEVVAALDAGADDVVVSPVAFKEVAARLRALTRRPADRVATELEVGSLRLDPEHRRARRLTEDGEVEIELTPRECAALEALMRSPGLVITRTRIAELVWGAETDHASNLVDQVVSHLRRKIDRPFDCSDIRTVRGTGYRIVDSRAEALAG